MMKYILIAIMALGLAVSPAVASDTNSVFNAKEVGVTLTTSYQMDQAADFSKPYTFNLSAGLSYFPLRNIGVEASVPFYSTRGVSVDRVNAGLLARLPIGPVAPYIGLGGQYGWSNGDDWTYVGKAGLELRLNSKWGVFGEWQYQNKDFNWAEGANTLAGGLRLVF